MKSFWQCIFNNTFINIGLLILYCQVLYKWEVPYMYDTNSLPDSWTFAKHIMICIITEDFGFHMAHRLFHSKYKYFNLYGWYHKQHHEYKHPISITSEYSHPVEYAISNHFPSFIGMLLLGKRMHIFEIMIWGTLRILETHDGHSGYEFPWSIFRLIPFGSDATYHTFHHAKNVGNYSSFMTIWDTIFNSNSEFYEAYPEGSRVDEHLQP